MKIGIIGDGAIGRYVHEQLLERGHVLRALVLLPERLQAARVGNLRSVTYC